MNAWTRLLTMPLAVVLLTAGCAAGATSSPPAPSSAVAATPRGTLPPSPRPSVPPPATSPTVAEIARLEALTAADPADAEAHRDLGFALLQRVRETADPTLYAPAAEAFETARRLAPDDSLVLAGIGGLHLGKHEFAEALAIGREAVAASPNLAAARVIVVDALIELGRYDEAAEAAGEMLAIRADLSTLARFSYIAELQGDLDVALSAMREAAAAPGLAPENVAYIESLLGNLFVYTGDPVAAADAYGRALALVPAHAPSLAGQGRLSVGAGDLDAAIRQFQRAADILPLPEYVIALAEAQEAAGLADEAARNVKLARAEIELFQASGVIIDVELALFEADHGDPAKGLAFAEAGYKATPTVRAADSLAWALHRLGRNDEAKKHSDEALRLGWRDPLARFHAGAIAAALGDVKGARSDLELALSTDPGFSATGAAEARRILDSLPD